MEKNLTEKERHENFRKKLWCKVYLAYALAPNAINVDRGKDWADKALERFDERFKLK